MLATIAERSNLRRAFERVRENCGCRGADGMTIGRFAADLERELDRLQDRLLRGCYQPFPLLQIPVPKRAGGNELQALLDGIGFDPYIGFYHRLDYGRPSLALDLLEEFRPALVDRLTARLLNRRFLRREDFSTSPEGGLYLGRDGKRRYFAEYEKELNTPFEADGQSLTFRDLFRRQADRLAAAITRGEPYESFRLPC